ncbi:MAG: TldD/PmbA family protein [Candidatus Heimdallarchaeota archaeon]|nr:TldD/PmbA family protein [Candidatus Heimdallarchaeota archaeon]
MDSRQIHEAINFGLKRGADQLEFFILHGNSETVQIEKSAIKASENKSISGMGIRAYTKKGLGIATTTLLTECSLKELTKKAVQLSKIAPPDELFKSLPGPFTAYPKVNGLYDKTITNFPDGHLTDLAIEAIEAGLEKHNVIISGSFEREVVEESIYNSLGVEVNQKATALAGVIYAKAERSGDIATSWDYQRIREAATFNPVEIGSNAAKNAVSLLGAKKVKSGEMAVILDQRSTQDTFLTIFGTGLNAYEVLLKTAFFMDRLGQKITHEQITVHDNPLYPGGSASAIFDDEGVPHQKITLIKKGIAIAYFSNSYTANALNIPNTAHAAKSNLGGIPYPDLNQLQIEAGDWSSEELIRETKKGIYLKDTPLEPTTGSPNISILVDQGFLIEKGEITHPLKETMIGTNVFSLLKNIDAVGKELLNEAGSIAPMIRISKATVSSEE